MPNSLLHKELAKSYQNRLS